MHPFPPNGRASAAHALRLFFAALAALWTVDVLVNLGLLPGVWFPDPLAARVRDFVGLLVASSQVALALMLAALSGGRLVSRVGGRGATLESVAGLAAALSGLEVLAQTRIVWGATGSSFVRGLVLGSMAGAAVWVLVRFAGGLVRVEGFTLSEVVRPAVFAPIVTGYANLTLADVVKGRGRFVFVHGALALVWLALARLSAKPRGLGRIAALSPLAAALALAVWSSSAPPFRDRGHPTGAPDPARPPIFLVVLDTVRADHLALYGYRRDTMPALEHWAERAFVATRAVSPAGWTLPAHASIFSGLPVSLHGIHYGERSFVTPPVAGLRWLPELLAAAGYRTVAVSANPLALPAGIAGFDEVRVPRRGPWHASSVAALVDHRSPLLRRVGERLRWRMPYAAADEIVDLVLGTLPAGDGPLFAFVNVMDAHSPYNPPASALRSLGVRPGRSFARYRSHRELTRMWGALPPSKSDDLADLYDAELRGVDAALARLFDGIETRYGGRAVVIVASDHGEELGEEERVGHERGLAQRLLHVPLVIRGAGFPVGRFDQVADLRRLHDVILSVANGGAPDLAPLFAADAFGVVAERYPSGEAGGETRPWVSLIADGRKGVGPSAAGFALYDLAASFDRDEPLADAGTGGLRERVDAYWETHRDRREETASHDEDERKRLRSLGYVN